MTPNKRFSTDKCPTQNVYGLGKELLGCGTGGEYASSEVTCAFFFCLWGALLSPCSLYYVQLVVGVYTMFFASARFSTTYSRGCVPQVLPVRMMCCPNGVVAGIVVCG